jgi:hypothetical protein
MNPEDLLYGAVFWIDTIIREPGIVCLSISAPEVNLTLSEDC